ncbi:peptidoglycan-binding protein [Okeania sp. KiyG1]|uniref:peptidoglycan-binding domain-containing protein n=1 Tax=Okeania sp. KiyG1 TaxID=2720165 RepID=UPI0019224D7A|nr:peptidoglycan-binding protein [Okeania sp. KiyG1]GGA03371.1 hypothetical protein CYANOKiyG1_15530 [Okeania sp. KiyG1]
MSSFSIHQFSSGIRNPQQNREGKWVSGGYDKEIAKESYNVPPEIKKAVNTSSKGGWRGFGIPDASPPKTGDYALIARELENYCVLAVANKQQDDHNREFIAYRYFWLDKQEFQNERDFSDFDGIATLLYHWQKEGRLQYNIREWANSPELYTNSWDKLKKYEKKTRFFQQNSTRIKPFISNINSDNQSLHYNEPLIYEANEIGVSLRPEEVHCLAIQYSYVKKCSINWAWNVRRLENMQDLPVIYCADAKALNLFGQELIKRRPILDKSAGKMVKGSGGYPTDRDPKTKEIQILIREFRLGQFTEEDVLTLMNYYQEYKQNIVQFEDKFTINYFSTQLPKPSVQNIKYVTLLTALDPTKNKNILSQLMKKLNNKLKNEVAIKFLDDLLRIVTQNPHCFDSEVCGLFCKKFTYTRWKILNLRVIYLAKTKTLNWLNQDLIKYMPRLNKSSGEAAKDLSKHSDDKPKEKIQDFLQKFCGQFTEEDLLKLMNYYQKYGQDIVDSESENVINNLRDEASKNKAKNIKYATLLAALAPREKQDILDELVNLNNHPKNKVDINKVAINFLDELLMTATLSSKCLKHPICELFCKNFTYTKFKLIGCLDDNHSTSSSMRIVFLLIPFFVLSGVASAWIYWRPNIPITIPTIFPSKQGSLAELLDKYDSQYKELEKLEQNQEKNPERKDVLSEELYRGKEKILQKLTDTKTEQYIRQLENREPEQVKDAREKEIYTNLKQFTPEIITGKLPVLNLGIQNNEVNVTTLQKALERNENYTIGQKYDELGIFDKPTKEAVENLQRRYIETLEKDSKTTDMKKDGIVGANTWNLLVGRLNDLQVEKVYETLKNHLNPENKTDENIVSEIEKCRDSNQNEKALMFVNCLEKLNQPSSLAELLNKYDSQYKEFKKLEENQEENEKFKNVLYEYNEKIINKLTDLQAEEYIQQLENREPEQVKDAREKEIYTNLTQFTPEIITEKLPVLNLGIQNNEVNVTTLQKALERNKNYTTGQKYDELGIFDRPTKAAVENLQHRYIETLKNNQKEQI